MSTSSKSKGLGERRARYRAGSRSRSSSGVEVVLRGWKPGLRKVQLTQAFRDGGNPLSEAVDLTGRVLEGEEVRARFAQYSTVTAARKALSKIGIEEITSA